MGVSSAGSRESPEPPLLPFPPGAPALTHLLPDTAGPESSALPAPPAAPAACGLGGRSAAAWEGGLAVPGWRAAPGLLSPATGGVLRVSLSSPHPLAPALNALCALPSSAAGGPVHVPSPGAVLC